MYICAPPSVRRVGGEEYQLYLWPVVQVMDTGLGDAHLQKFVAFAGIRLELRRIAFR